MQYVERVLACQPIWRSWVDGCLDRLLPRRCLVCSLDCGPAGICDICLADFPRINTACRRCALPLPEASVDTCGPCLLRPPPFRRSVSPFLYEFPVRQLIHQFKFRRDLAAGRALSGLLLQRILDTCPERPDCIVPVPLHRFRLLRRGFNQAYEIARHVAGQLDAPLPVHSLRRTRSTTAQSGLDARQRRRNLRGAFAWRGRDLAGSHIALVDDVMTTGTTVRECTRVLLQAGAERVDTWVLARAAGQR